MKNYVGLLILSILVLATSLLSGDGSGKAPEPKEQKSKLIGTWASSLSMGKTGPSHIDVVEIDESGKFHWIRVQVFPKEIGGKKEKKKPVIQDLTDSLEAEVDHYEVGEIDLKTGSQTVTATQKALSVKSIHWGVSGTQLRWYQDMGTMGGQGTSFRRIDDSEKDEPEKTQIPSQVPPTTPEK